MEYVELRIRVKDTRNILAWRQNAPPIEGVVHYEALARQTIRVLTRWVAEDRVSRRDELAVLGSHLYRILFANAVEKELQEAQAHQKKTDATLRIVLEFMPEARELATLPWEYLYVPDDDKSGTGFFVAAENRLILSRHVPLIVEEAKPESSPLRVLLVVSQPSYESVEEDRDGERVTTAKDMGIVRAETVVGMLTELQAESHGRIRVTELRDPDKLALNTALADCQPHIVHFIGHGRYRERVGALAFVKKTPRGPQATWLSDTAFADCFRDVTAPRLIFLHACEGARSDSYEAFSGVSLQLVYSRMPAVIAMQYPIPNDVAIAFARSLYGALSDGAAIDEAVQAGRRKLGIYLDDDENFNSRAFGSPVVFLQSKNAESLKGIVTPEVEATAQKEGTPGRLYRCPNVACGSLINPDRQFCPNPLCRRPFKFCTNCHEAIARDAIFCDNCNTDVDVRPAAAQTAPGATPLRPLGGLH